MTKDTISWVLLKVLQPIGRIFLQVLAMVMHLGLPTFFMTLICADFHWNELISIIAKLNGEKMVEEGIYNVEFF